MLRKSAVFALLICSCGELTQVPPPPVALSAIRHVQAAADGSPGYASTGARVRLVRAVAPNALLTLHLPDIGGAVERFKRTGLAKLFDSPEMRAMLGGTINLTATPFSASGAPFDVARLQRALQGELIVALERLTIVEGEQVPDIRALAGVSVAGAEREADQLVEMLGMMAAAQPGVTVEKGTVSSTGFNRIVGKTPWPWVVEFAVHRDALLIGYGRDSVTAAVSRLIEADAKSLADDEGYRTCMKRCAGPHDALRLTLNVAELWKRYADYLPADGRRFAEALGVHQLRGFATAVKFEDADIAISTFIDSPRGDDFLTKLFAAHPVDRQFLERIPANAKSFSVFALDGARVLAKLREALPDEMRRDLQKGLARIRKDGLDLEKDVFEVFGPRCALVAVPFDRPVISPIDAVLNQLLGSALVVEVQDPAAARAVLARLPDRTDQVRRREFVVDGVNAVSYRFVGSQMPEEVSISYALEGSHLIVAPTEDTLRQMLRERSPDTVKRFRTLLGDVPETVAVLSYEDLRDGPGLQFQMMMAGFLNGLSMARGGGHAPDMRLDRQLTMNLGHSVSYTVADDEGIYSVTRSPTGGLGSTGGVFGLAVIAAIAVPNLLQARLSANEASALASLRSIEVAQRTFRDQRFRDLDSDGEGEFGYLVELMGRRRPGEREPRNLRTLVGTAYTLRDGDWSRAGYYFRIYLPAEDGSPVGGYEKAGRIRQVDGDLAETIMVVVAWPISRGVTGNRAFLLDSTGTIYACEDGPYDGDKPPSPDLLSSQKGNLASQPLRPGTPTRDGWHWKRLRD